LQLKELGLAHKFQELLEECARVRVELGYPIMITPFAQFVGTQAVLNVVHGQRYRYVPDEVKKYALGYYGKLLAPITPDILDAIVQNGSPHIALSRSRSRPGSPSCASNTRTRAMTNARSGRCSPVPRSTTCWPPARCARIICSKNLWCG